MAIPIFGDSRRRSDGDRWNVALRGANPGDCRGEEAREGAREDVGNSGDGVGNTNVSSPDLYSIVLPVCKS